MAGEKNPIVRRTIHAWKPGEPAPDTDFYVNDDDVLMAVDYVLNDNGSFDAQGPRNASPEEQIAHRDGKN